MKAATVKELGNELKHLNNEELRLLCLRLSKFKKENKELLTYLLFESSDEDAFIQNIKEEVSETFSQVNRKNYYYIKKSVRSILKRVKTYIRYSKLRTTEVELLLHFCIELKKVRPSISGNNALTNLYLRQLSLIHKTILLLHEDLQFDYLNVISEHDLKNI